MDEMNPFIEHRNILLYEHYGTALRIQAIVLHLFNDEVPAPLSTFLSTCDVKHLSIVLAIIQWYAKHGENCPEFMAVGRELADRHAERKAS